MTTTVSLPATFTVNELYSFTGSVVDLAGTPRDIKFTFDFGKLTFIDGSGLTVFCSTLELLRNWQVTIYFDNYDDVKRYPIAYLDDCGFFERYLGEKLNPSSAPRASTLPFQKVQHADAYGWLEYPFTPWMAGVLGVNSDALGSIRSSIKEVFNNILDHSTRDTGFVHVQHYPNRGDVRVSISDTGKGIPANVRTKFPGMKDGAAILRATESGFTTKSRKNNMGVGLDFLVDCVTGNQGLVNIFSFQGALRCRPVGRGKALRQPTTMGTSSYPGTLVELVLRIGRFIGDDASEVEVTW